MEVTRIATEATYLRPALNQFAEKEGLDIDPVEARYSLLVDLFHSLIIMGYTREYINGEIIRRVDESLAYNASLA